MLGFNGLPKCTKIYKFLLGDNLIYLQRKKNIFNKALEFLIKG